MSTMPVIFVSHGSPMLALDPKGGGLRAWGGQFPRPTAILAISAHWQRTPPTLGAGATVPLIYDFSGFPPELSAFQYPAPGATALGKRVAELLTPRYPLAQEPARGWDHGVWVPLAHLAPKADIPLLQLSLPGRMEGGALIELGRLLAPLRDEGVLIMASGGVVHNLGLIARDAEGGSTPDWAANFDAWVTENLDAWNLSALAGAPNRSPDFHRAHPTPEHYLPLLVAVGAADPGPHGVNYPITGFEYGSLSIRCVQMG